jgi:hypothetical protein
VPHPACPELRRSFLRVGLAATSEIRVKTRGRPTLLALRRARRIEGLALTYPEFEGAPQGISADDAKKLSFRGPHLPEESAFSEILRVPHPSFLRVGLGPTSEIRVKTRPGSTNIAQGGSLGQRIR